LKYAIFSDIHSNLEALKAAVCLGDIVGYGPDPAECLESVRAMKCPTVRGNHDHHAALPKLPSWFSPLALAGLVYSRAHLSKVQKKYLARLPLTLENESFEAVHASLDRPMTWPYVLDGTEAEWHFEAQKKPVCFCGHTHQPCVWHYEKKLFHPGVGTIKLNATDRFLVNVGSVGLPRDEDHRACYVIYEPKLRQVKFRRVPYDVAGTQGKIIKAGLPPELAAKLAADGTS
jgi:diadenosine tetraphosphatase ApaH/serine/threonine PP2A family protein phosphatase